MLTSRIKITNFKIIKKNKISLSNSFFQPNNLFSKFPILKTLSSNYKYSFNKKIVKRLNRFSIFRLIGMGGSTLGAEAIYQFLQNKTKKKFIFINNLKPILNKNEKNKKACNLIISKSGNTLETILNSSLLINKNKNVFITENKSSNLFNLANKLKSEVIEHKNYVGGRYSVLSEVGMLPAELMGFKEKKFKRFNKLVKNKNFINNLIINVNSILTLVKQKKLNSIILNYDENSNNLFKWYQQLVAESLGKKSKGILPIISTMPKDNHSLMQLYLDGPKNNFYTFFSVNEKKTEKFRLNKTLNALKYLNNKSFTQIIRAQKKATEIVFKKEKLPFRSFEIKNRSEETLGELFSFFILETILLGTALKVNPFDQPSVELIKKETKKILS
tara:strand:+ start:1174 stop:2337 length:1164 start_codon:yes stop_codon:yes gene_type:complete